MLILLTPICTWSKDFEAGVGEVFGVSLAKEFIREEHREIEDALPRYTVATTQVLSLKSKLETSENDSEEHIFYKEELEKALLEEKHYGDEVIDGFCDVVFVAINGLYKFFRSRGIDHDEAIHRSGIAFTRVIQANDAKRQPDGSVLRENNKVVKPEGWTPPYHGDLL